MKKGSFHFAIYKPKYENYFLQTVIVSKEIKLCIPSEFDGIDHNIQQVYRCLIFLLYDIVSGSEKQMHHHAYKFINN